MIRHRLASVLLLLCCCAVYAASPRSDFIEHSVEILGKAFSDGIAVSYPDFRSIQYGPLFGKKNRDALAFFSIEGFNGGNSHAEYLALY